MKAFDLIQEMVDNSANLQAHSSALFNLLGRLEALATMKITYDEVQLLRDAKAVHAIVMPRQPDPRDDGYSG
jgi:hypothetical protein